MKLRVITLITIALTLIALVSVVYTLSSHTLHKLILQLEDQHAALTLGQVQTALQNEANDLNRVTADWATWDDIFHFIEDPSTSFIQQNLNLPAVQNLHIHEALILDRQGKVLYSATYDLEANKVLPSQSGLQELIQEAHTTLMEIRSGGEATTGLLLLPAGPYVVCISPVMDSQAQYPSNGFLVFGRRWIPNASEAGPDGSGVSTTVLSISDPRISAQFKPQGNDGDPPNVAIQKQTEIIRGFVRVDGILNQPENAIFVEIPREIARASRKTLAELLMGILLVGVGFIALSAYVVEKLILQRIAALNTGIAQIGKVGNLSTRLQIPGQDELASLAGTINQTLDALEQAQHEHLESEERHQAEKQIAGEALRESEARYQNLVENLPIGIYRTTPGPLGKILVANRAFLSMFGFQSMQEAQQTHVADAWLDPSRRKQFSDAIIANGSVTNAELELKRTDGAHLWGLVTAKAVKDGGQVQFFDCTIQDISDRKRAEKIQETVYQISQATYNAHDLSELFYSIHQNLGNLMHVENFYIALYDEKNQLLSFPYFVDQYDTSDPEPTPLGHGMTEYVLRTRKPALVDPDTYNLLAELGEVELVGSQSIDWLGVPLITKDRCIGVIAVQSYTPNIRFTREEEDILVFVSTQVAWAIERKQADDRIRESETRYRAIVEDQIDLIVRTGPDGVITFANEVTGRYFGLHPGALIGMHFLDLFPISEREKVQESLAAVRNHNPISFVVTELDCEPQEHRWQEWRHRGIFDDTGSLLEIQSVGLDSTPRKIRDREMEALLSISADIRTCDKRSDMQRLLGEKVAHLFDPTGQILAMVDPYTSEFVVEFAQGEWKDQAGKRFAPGDHIISRAVDTTGPVLAGTPGQEWGIHLPNPGARILECLIVPLTTRHHPVGAIVIGSRRHFRPDEVRLVNAIADIAANALHRASLFEQTDSRLRRLVALRAIDIAITSSLDLQVTLSVLLDQIVAQLHIHACDVLLYDPYSRLLEFAAGRGFRSPTFQKTRLRLGEGPAGRAVTERRLVSIGNLHNSLDPSFQGISMGEDFVAYFAVPLIAKGQVRGVLELYHRSMLSPDMEWLDFLEAVATQAAIAIDNAELFNKLQRSNVDLTLAYDATIEGWSRALELRDHETEGHTQRVTDLTLRLASSWGVPEADLVHIRRGCLLHDIGKMAIPDQILFKPGPLTEDEWEVMRLHPVYAYQLLAPVPYLRPALDIPYCHHEKWDGTGYPRKLAGEQIPLTARLFAVADIWDALRSDRPYRKAWPDDQVKTYISGISGSHLDPRVVALFLAIESR